MNTSDGIVLFSAIASLLVGAAVVFATFMGPILAARGADLRRQIAEKRADRMRVFRDLMGYRYDVMHPSYVASLNLVQVEFVDSPAIMTAYDAYLKAFDRSLSDRDDCAQVRQKAIIKLLYAVGRDLGYELEQLDLMEQVYSPQQWADIANEQKVIREMFADIAKNKRPLPVLAMIPPIFVHEETDGKKASIRVTSTPQ